MTCAGRTQSRSSSGRGRSRAAGECSSATRSPTGSRRCAISRRASTSGAPLAIPTGRGPDDLEIKIHELREITDWEKPIFVKVGATRTYYTIVQLAVKAGADVIVVDGMQGGTAATRTSRRLARRHPDAAGDETRRRRASGARDARAGAARSSTEEFAPGADVAKALALGADAVSIGTCRARWQWATSALSSTTSIGRSAAR